jgi:hypothetical protein
LGLDRRRFRFQHERPAGGQIEVEVSRRKGNFQRLPSDGVSAAVIQFVAEDHFVRAAGAGLDPTFLVTQVDDAADDLTAAKGRLLDDAGRPQDLDERQAGAVAAGHLGLIDPQFAIIDLQAGQGGHDMLDHIDGGLIAAKDGPPRGFDAMFHRGGDAGASLQVGADENNARVGRGGPELDANVASGPVSHPLHRGGGGYRSLMSCDFHASGARHP